MEKTRPISDTDTSPSGDTAPPPALPKIEIDFDKLVNEPFSSETANLKPRPWVRYGARYIDTFLYSFSFGILLGVLGKVANINTNLGPIGLTALGVTAGTLLIEPYLLSSLGTTPGKWLFRIRVRTAEGAILSFDQAAKRTLRVVFQGLGCAIPIFGIPLMIYQYRRLKKKGRTSWDNSLNLLSSHQSLGESRIFLGLSLIGLVLALTYL